MRPSFHPSTHSGFSARIFEHREDESDSLQIIVGQPQSNTSTGKIPLSRRYAVLLAELAYQRGFDGYLLNFEYKLKDGTEQARALAAWILLLRAELQAKVGPQAQAMW
jgi:mannosyl-glycoprotein endo-beta-N-acetylglucosaminidase